MTATGREQPRTPTDRGSRDKMVNRVFGLVVILAGFALAYSLMFTEFDQRVTFQWEFVNGDRVPITHITCPSPWSVLDEGTQPEGVVSGDLCVKPARGQMVQSIGVALLTLTLGAWVFTRDPRRKALPPLPSSVRALLEKR